MSLYMQTACATLQVPGVAHSTSAVVYLLLLCAWSKDLVKVELVLLAVHGQGQAAAASKAANHRHWVRPHTAEDTDLRAQQIKQQQQLLSGYAACKERHKGHVSSKTTQQLHVIEQSQLVLTLPRSSTI
jgi:hypothetical protein